MYPPRRQRSPRRVAPLLALGAMLWLAASALAAPPARSIDRVDATNELPVFVCGFPVTEMIEGTLRHTIFVDADGQPVRMLDTSMQLRFTFTSPETGASTSFLGVAAAHITPNPDGSLTVVLTGLGSRIQSPDGGSLAINVGRMILHVAGTGPDEVVEAAGQFSGNVVPAVCEALANPS